MKNAIIFIFGYLLLTTVSFGQKGIIRGNVHEAKTGEDVLFGTVSVIGFENLATTTDLEGSYQINIEAGTYTLEFSYLGLKTYLREGVVVKANEVTLVNAPLEEESQVLEEVVVKAAATRNTEVALATIRRNSSNVLDGISSGNFKKIGDSDAASAMKRVTGVSVEGGKYVFVRGLGDRYTKSTLNGMEVPGLDPDRNTLQMDIFPTSILDNIIVLKTFTADLPADFTGGVVNIATKDFPEEKNMTISGGLSYNPDMHFNSSYLSSSKSSSDFLGFDDGLRAIPTNKSTNIPFRTDALVDPQGVGKQYGNILQGFNPNMAVSQTRSFADFSLGFSLGNQIQRSKYAIGYNVGLSYINNTEYYTDVEYNLYGKDRIISNFQLEERVKQKGSFGSNNVIAAGLGGLSFKTKTSKIALSLMHIQNGESKNGIFSFTSTNFGANFSAFQHNIEYSERRITNVLLKGEHSLAKGKWDVRWNLSPTLSSIYDPDIRIARYRNDGTSLTIGTESGIPERTWRFLDEINYNGNTHIDYKYKVKGQASKLKMGLNAVIKQRDFEIQNFQIYTNGMTLTGNPDEIFNPANLWSPENLNGVTYDPQFIPFNPNKFNSSSSNFGGYISNEMYVAKKLKAIAGVRVEKFDLLYSGRNQNRETFSNKKMFDEFKVFPTANFIYELTGKQNLRVSYARTVARPSFKEASFATILDPISGRTFIGGFFKDINVQTGEEIWDGQLVSTDIDNFDLRWEMFQEEGQLISVSSFYKMLKNPIEIVQYVQAAGNFQPRNVGNGTILGFEFEIFKNLGGINNILSNIHFNLNATYVYSQVEMSASELQSRQLTAREGQEIKNTRPMAGQAPYIINSGLTYKAPKSKMELGLFYNVQGRTLRFVGVADRPDVYTVPFHSLNLNFNIPFGEDDRFSAGCKINNILNSVRQEVFSAYNADDQIFTNLNPGRSFSLRFAYQMR
ncbi:MAG: TonB-dependent receptor [Saprospiraceae bacterium]|nr:TonB-dependent receptor [Saprospiraceae bacterium]MBK8371822.1 TonB-dependent receptor [Saprospiraceae bacterium]MBK8853321.1 TonB-dependent receptor [Saprospiraceae bacterium]MBK9042094.1 TonB-dependent receptor [Saprospiraceae bacterium]